MGLLFYHYLARKKGYTTFYLGQSVPHVDLVKVVAVHRPELLITSFITSLNEEKLKDFVRTLSTDFKKQTILISGLAAQKSNFSAFKNIRQFRTSLELKALL
jgi:hypothetical protein